MKKIRRMSIVLLLISTAAFAIFRVYEWTYRDTEAPVITCPDKELTVSVAAGEKALLKHVTAEDNKSGDVSSSLVVEDISPLNENGERVITYAAIDEAGNVGSAQRKMRYKDYQPPRLQLTEPLRFPTGNIPDLTEAVRAESVLDGDLSSKIKYSLENSSDIRTEGMRYANVRVTDSAGWTSELKIPVEMYDASEEAIEVSLNAYMIYISAGTGFDAFAYYAGADQDGTLEIQSNVDTTVPGVYYTDYIVSNAARYGRSRLIVVVE